MTAVAPLLFGTSVGALGPILPTAGLFGIGGKFALGTALNTVATAATVGGGLLGGASDGYAQQYQYQAQQQQLRAQQQAAEYNRLIALQNAQIVEGQTRAELEKADRERRLRQGAAIASAGASGIGIESFGDIMQSSATQEELDLLTLESEGMLRKREFETQAGLLGAEASSYGAQIPMVQSAARSSASAARTGTAARVIGGISSGLGMYSSATSGGRTFLDGSARVSNGVKWNTSRSGSYL